MSKKIFIELVEECNHCGTTIVSKKQSEKPLAKMHYINRYTICTECIRDNNRKDNHTLDIKIIYDKK